MDNIQCYYTENWIMIENEKKYFFDETENFINFYPIKIKKKELYKIIYYDGNVKKIHDKKQCKIDIPRYTGNIRRGNVLYKFKVGDYSYKTLMETLKKYFLNIRQVGITPYLSALDF